jgi:hypothetical protein
MAPAPPRIHQQIHLAGALKAVVMGARDPRRLLLPPSRHPRRQTRGQAVRTENLFLPGLFPAAYRPNPVEPIQRT